MTCPINLHPPSFRIVDKRKTPAAQLNFNDDKRRYSAELYRYTLAMWDMNRADMERHSATHALTLLFRPSACAQEAAHLAGSPHPAAQQPWEWHSAPVTPAGPEDVNVGVAQVGAPAAAALGRPMPPRCFDMERLRAMPHSA